MRRVVTTDNVTNTFVTNTVTTTNNNTVTLEWNSNVATSSSRTQVGDIFISKYLILKS
jgi:hypothetical protein